MSAAAINDPDLLQAIEDLEFTVGRLEQMNRLINDLDENDGYERLARMKRERADLQDAISTRADRLQIPARALALVVSTAIRLRTPRKRALPTLAAVRNHIEIVADTAARDQAEAEAEAKIARVTARGAGLRAQAGRDAMTYLDASRS